MSTSLAHHRFEDSEHFGFLVFDLYENITMAEHFGGYKTINRIPLPLKRVGCSCHLVHSDLNSESLRIV